MAPVQMASTGPLLSAAACHLLDAALLALKLLAKIRQLLPVRRAHRHICRKTLRPLR